MHDSRAFQSVDKPYTSRIGLHNLSRSAALLFSPSGAGFNEPSTARARWFPKDELCQQSKMHDGRAFLFKPD